MTPPRRQLARRLWIAAAVVIGLPLLAPLIALPGAKARVLEALQAGLGRRVEAQELHLRLLPLPGVELDQVRLGEDPAFGLEDMVVADDAVASVRLRSLLSGRLAFSRIRLDRASINLVRNRAGDWNVSALLDRTAQGGSAPRGRALPPSQRFPYLEWSDARINFKLEQVKQRFYLDQVEGSLARDSGGWRLEARFQPQRTDLNLSDTGEVTVDGRWPAAGAGFHQRPFDLVLHLSNSYLAASSALVLGHDAGVHGVLSAQVHVQGTGARFELSGAVQAQSLRRWDLLPPPATVSSNFLAAYYPGEDRLVLAGAGDAGFRHIHLQGEVANVFTHPAATLQLRLRQYPTAGLLPLLMAVKANLPPGLEATGVADGEADLRWNPGLGGKAAIRLTDLGLAADGDRLVLPNAQMQWDGRALRLSGAPAALTAAGGAATPLSWNARLDRQGFAVQWASPELSQAAMAALAHVLGMRSPWPAGLVGRAQARLGLEASWQDYRQAGWSGSLAWRQARYRPPGSDLELSGVTVTLDDPRPRQAAFTVLLAPGAAPVTGTVRWAAGTPAQPPQFTLRAPRARDTDLWRIVHPAPRDLMQRVLGDTTPDWLQRLRASGRLQIADFSWQGMSAGVDADLATDAQGHWQAPRLRLTLAGGEFDGRGSLANGEYTLAGTAARPLQLAALLADTPYRGLLSGALTGTLTLTRALGAEGLAPVEARGTFAVRGGSLATAAGARSFERLSGSFELSQGKAAFSELEWLQGGQRWQGQGSANFGDPPGTFSLSLSDGARRRVLRGRLRAAPRP